MLRYKQTLGNEFPQFESDINRLKLTDAHFRKLFDEFHFLAHELEKMEQKSITFTSMTQKKFTKQRTQLKDILFGYLKKEAKFYNTNSAA
ncbi:YdcH family protein [Marinomonas transparens]|uniref:GTP-binding protein n=1 Tax=Marinomonas transparens TaxID=2795388 RepID=A0A934JJR1_9GAMM|nr:GTP-binding protein [Marinomonas transparens]MBJ7537375.1 GTP-binding protein [Marinomonas transparens]